MPGEIPFFVTGKVAIIHFDVAYVKVSTGNVYHIHPWTPGIDFSKLAIGKQVECEVTRMLTRVLSAKIEE